MSSALAPAGTGARLDRAFFGRPVGEVAIDLLGCVLTVDGVGGMIVETERYQQDDPASHSFRGPRGRAAVMFGPPGHMYVYRSYGLHWCANLVCEPEGSGAAVLIRALAPMHGIPAMRARRRGVADRLLCAGPGRLCSALAIDRHLDGADALRPGGPVALSARVQPVEVVTGPRIGITKAADRPWRFGVAGSPYLSKPFRSR
ncbi:MAG TPA: DNA-3-methyladenine glycosylase [Miltoncostaea sp.]|nr:DNA-3-methyladenine glycosylase [Miltoncostaea sp.]